ncbi:MAG: hypothetical protein DMH00_13440, partial [Acidobacteria bacterium]
MDHYRTLVDLRRLTRTLRFLLLTGALAFVLMYLVVALSRLFYPFDLEFMEGGLLHQVRRVVSGEGLYVPPSLGYTAFPYPPLYFYAAAAVATLTRLGFAPLRIISFAASLGSLVLIYRFVRRETESAFCGILSASLFAATFRIGGASFDLARVDSLFLFLLLAGVYVLRKSSSRPSACAAGLLMGLSFLTKQTALVVGLSLGLQSLLPGKRRGRVLFTLVFFGVIGASTFLMNALSSGWYSFYCFQQFRHHDLVRDQILGFWTADV